MRLQLTQPFLSISHINDIELPAYTLLTGPNGVGKTHLLKGLVDKKISISGENIRNDGDIIYYDWTSFVPGNLKNIRLDQLLEPTQQVYQHLESAKVNTLTMARKLFTSLSTEPFTWESFLAIENNHPEHKKSINNILNNVINVAQQRMHPNNDQKSLFDRALSEHDPKSLVSNPELILGCYPVPEINFFQQSIATIFLAYSDAIARNLMHIGAKSSEALTDIEFENQYGPPPWDLVNDTLCRCGLDFHISHPDPLKSHHGYNPKITKRTSQAQIQFSDMSSGERVLISLALCLYNISDSKIITKKPRMVLFDEIDAVLHPKMSQIAVDVINDNIVKRAQVPVFMTTHAPTTVAVAPEESVHVITEGINIEKCGRQRAIYALTYGIPTLAIDYSGRRQVFVESDNDVKYHESIYTILRASLNSERSLHFIATGVRSSAGDINSGCDNVIRIVNDLRISGNQSVYGLIDWDKKNKCGENIYVIGGDTHYSIENLILNPLALGALLLMEIPQIRNDINFNQFDLFNDPSGKSQLVAEYIINAINNTKTPDMANSIVSYNGRFTCQYPTIYCTMPGHELERLILKRFPILNRLGNHEDSLKSAVIERVFAICPKLIPAAFQTTYDEILNV